MILIVRHGPGRGRIPGYCEHVLEWIRSERRDLGARVRVHETGSGPVELDGVSAVFFWLADPLEIRYPDCYAEAMGIQEEAARRSIRVLNPPWALAEYGKSHQHGRWAAAGIQTPEVRRVESMSSGTMFIVVLPVVGNTASRCRVTPLNVWVSDPTKRKSSVSWNASTPRPRWRVGFHERGTPLIGSTAAMPGRATPPGPSSSPRICPLRVG